MKGGERITLYKILDRNREEKRICERLRRKWEVNIGINLKRNTLLRRGLHTSGSEQISVGVYSKLV